MRLLFTLLFLITFVVSTPSYADIEVDPQNNGNPTSSGDCNWDAYLNKLADQESLRKCGDEPSADCKAVQYKTIRDDPNPLNNGSRDASWGRFQFIPSTWASLVQSEYPQCVRYGSVTSLPGSIGSTKSAPNLPYAVSESCWEVQDYAAQKFTEDNRQYLENNNWCNLLGTTVTGKHVGPGHPQLTCTVTKSGLLSAFHNGGKSCAKINWSNKTGSHLRSRICDAGGLAIPDACDPDKPNVDSEIKDPTGSTPARPDYISNSQFDAHGDGLKLNWVASLMHMTTQISTFMIQQVQIIGTFFDAKHQLETQRLLQQKTAQAHKDYHPSKQMCEIGTFVRDLANSEIRTDVTKRGLMNSMFDRANMTGDAQTAEVGMDEETKRRAFLDTFCNSANNANQNSIICKGTYDPAQVNADIDFTRSIDVPLTLDIDMTDDVVTTDEENIFAFLDYIFMHERFPWLSKNRPVLFSFIEPYQDMRSLMALRSVAKNSFTEIIAQKTAGPNGEDDNVGPFLKAMMREFGIPDDQIEKEIGKNPSYYAQMEILTKKIYQHPEFIANLYDKPTNVKRIRAALTAIKLMQDRDIHDALQRREMLMSILLEIQLRQKQQDLMESTIRPVLNEPAGSPSEFGGGESGGGGADISF